MAFIYETYRHNGPAPPSGNGYSPIMMLPGKQSGGIVSGRYARRRLPVEVARGNDRFTHLRDGTE